MEATWLGLSDGYSEATFRWIDTMSLSTWAEWDSYPAGETDKDCVTVTGSDRLWKVEDCSATLYAFCMSTPRKYFLHCGISDATVTYL